MEIAKRKRSGPIEEEKEKVNRRDRKKKRA